MGDTSMGRPLDESWFTLTVGEFLANKEKFLSPLDFHRLDGWPLNKQRQAIDGLFRGYPPPPFEVKEEEDRLPIVNGTQYALAIVGFYEEKFRTFKDKEYPPYGSIVPNQWYSQVSPQWQAVYMSSPLTFHIIDKKMEEWQIADYYRRRQYSKPLSFPESLWTYPGEPKRQTVKLLDHPFWQDLYRGPQSRRQPYLGCCYMMLLELANSGTRLGALSEGRLYAFVAGTDRSSVNAALIETIRKRLDLVNHVFHGTSLKDAEEVIPVYQAISILEKEHIDPEKVTKGCLTDWYRQAREKAENDFKAFRISTPLLKMHCANAREYFWYEQTPEIVDIAKAGETKSRQEQIQEIDPQEVVGSQKGLCPLCNVRIENVFDGNYVLQYKKDAPITTKTCAVVHKACYQQLISKIPGLELVAMEITSKVESKV